MSLKMAYKNIWRRKRRTLFNVTAVTISVAALVAFLALYRGSYGDMINNLIQIETGHFQFHQHGYQAKKRLMPLDITLRNHDQMTSKVVDKDINNEIDRIEHRIRFQGLVTKGDKTFGISAIGEHNAYGKENTLTRAVVEGSYFTDQDAPHIIIGYALAEVLDVKVGDTVSLFGQTAYKEQNFDYFTVVGISNIGFFEVDRHMVFVPLGAAQHFLDMEDQVTEVAVTLKGTLTSFWAFQPILRQAAIQFDMHGENWIELMPGIMDDLKGDMTFFVIFAFILIFLTAMGIANTTHMNVFERKKEIGTLRALGASQSSVAKLLLNEIILMCMIGIFFGFILGSLINLYLVNVGISYEVFSDAAEMISLPMGDRMFSQVAWYDYPLTFFVLIIASVGGALNPIRKINKLTVREALSEKI